MNQIIIGIAGYMGSGKTTCSQQLADLGGCAINADQEAKRLMQSSSLIIDRLQEAFGKNVVCNGTIQYQNLGKLAFKSSQSIAALNSIVHPVLIRHLKRCIEVKSEKVILLDAALIPLWDIEDWFDYCIWVDAEFNTRFNRLSQKDVKQQIDENEHIRRMKLQEELFSPPVTNKWVYIKNEYSKNEFIESVSAWVLSTPKLKRSLYCETEI